MPEDGPMRRPPAPALAVAIGVAGVLAGAFLVGTPSAVAAGIETLTVRPDHGRPTAPFTAEYRFTLPTGGSGGTCPAVTFGWDGRPLGQVHSGRLRAADPCVAVLGASPPGDDRTPGRHRIDVAAVAGHAARSVAYTVDPPATGTPSPTPRPPDPSSTATPRPGATPTRRATTAGAGQTGGPGAVVGLPSPAGSVAALDPGGPTLAGQADSTGGGLGAWVLIIGGLLVLGGVGIFGLLVYWSRRGGGGGAEPEAGLPDA
jgi:hypothetical protein